MRKTALAVCMAVLLASCVFAADEIIRLPEPEKTGGMTLLEAVSNRHSARNFEDVMLTPQQLSNLLWTTAGVNRDKGKRVYPSSMGIHDLVVYVFNREGIYRYDPEANTLSLVRAGDHRADTTDRQPFVAKAAVNLVYVHDINMWDGQNDPKDVIRQWGFAHTGAAMQNAYLYAASQGWNAVVRAWYNQETLSKLLNLTDGQRVTLVQSIGPKP